MNVPPSRRCRHLDNWFDRTICAEPCGSMHTYCSDCGKNLDYCPHDDPKASTCGAIGSTYPETATASSIPQCVRPVGHDGVHRSQEIGIYTLTWPVAS